MRSRAVVATMATILTTSSVAVPTPMGWSEIRIVEPAEAEPGPTPS